MTTERMYEIYPFNLLVNIVDDIYEVNLREFYDSIDIFLLPREKEVIEYRYKDKLTLEETAKKFDVTRERIRQVESKALLKMERVSFVERIKNISREQYEKLKYAHAELCRVCAGSLDYLKVNNIDVSKNIVENALKNIPIESLELSVRSYNCLKRAGVYSLDDLLNLGTERLKKVRNLGRKSYAEVLQKVHEKGYGFNPNSVEE